MLGASVYRYGVSHASTCIRDPQIARIIAEKQGQKTTIDSQNYNRPNTTTAVQVTVAVTIELIEKRLYIPNVLT